MQQKRDRLESQVVLESFGVLSNKRAPCDATGEKAHLAIAIGSTPGMPINFLAYLHAALIQSSPWQAENEMIVTALKSFA